MPNLRRLAPVLDRHPRAALILLCLVLWLPGFFTVPPTDRDESRFVQATKQMLETGDFVRIMNGTVPRNRKPIGIYWLQAPFAAAARATGVAAGNPVWPYRIPSLLGGIAAVLATYSLGLTLLARRRAALSAGAMLAGCVVLTVEAHIAKTDAALVGSTTIAMAVLGRAFMRLPVGRFAAALFWAALGAGILIKGPITPMVVCLAAAASSWAVRDASWLRLLRPARGVVLLIAVVAPWFIAIGLATHGAFFSEAVGGDLGRKLAGGEETHGGFPGLHAVLLPLLAFPATVPVLLGLRAAWRGRRARPAIFLLAWLIPSWLIFEAVPTKLPHYTLPLYPALMLMGAAWLTDPARIPAGPLFQRVSPVLAASAAGLIGLAAAIAPLALHVSAWWLGLPALVCAVLAGAAAGRLTRPGRLALAIPAAALLYAALIGLELPRLRSLWISAQAEAALRAGWPGDNPLGRGLIAAGYAEPSLTFLAGTDIVTLPFGAEAADLLGRAPDGAALIAAPALPDFLAEATRSHLAIRQTATIHGFNYSRGRSATLRLFLRDDAKR